ncbi:MAG: hypothetical protein II612_06550 [Prevotella sp.]|nr:hypothetical protein [Prevotella sp.]
MNDNWEDKFAAYDIGLPKSNGTSSNDATDIVSEVAPPIFLQDEQVVSSIKPETVKADKSVQRIQTKRYMDFPETGNMDLTAADLQQMSIHQENYKRVIGEMYNQALKMSAPDTSLRLPKGLRTIVQHLGDIVHVITATKAIIDTYLDISIESLFQSIEENGLKSSVTCFGRLLEANAPTLQAGLNDISSMMDGVYERPSANLRTRIVKGQSTVLLTYAVQQAEALAHTIDAFPLENGDLLLLSMIAGKGDIDIMTSIDKTMCMANSAQVLTADAPTMLKAIQENNQKTICLLQQRLIEVRAQS